jgi:AmmeMemoRadiSam system protein B
MSHYVSRTCPKGFPGDQADACPRARGLYDVVQKEDISMCGFQPTRRYLAAGSWAPAGDLIRYMTSGETSGDFDQVVGYAGLRLV